MQNDCISFADDFLSSPKAIPQFCILHFAFVPILSYIKEGANMASNRILLINEEIQKELSSLLRTVKDPRVQDVMISITRVETTPDLRYTKVYVSFLQEDKAADAMKGLKSAAGYLRRQLGTNLRLRYAPEIVWSLDDSITYGARMLGLINSLGVKHDEDSDEE
jgi:ribosome-binding factor A